MWSEARLACGSRDEGPRLESGGSTGPAANNNLVSWKMLWDKNNEHFDLRIELVVRSVGNIFQRN